MLTLSTGLYFAPIESSARVGGQWQANFVILSRQSWPWTRRSAQIEFVAAANCTSAGQPARRLLCALLSGLQQHCNVCLLPRTSRIFVMSCEAIFLPRAATIAEDEPPRSPMGRSFGSQMAGGEVVFVAATQCEMTSSNCQW